MNHTKFNRSFYMLRVLRWWSHSCARFQVPKAMLLMPAGAGTGKRLLLAHQRIGDAGSETNEHVEACGLFLELKSLTGRVTAEQQTFHQHLRAAGYRVEVVRSFDEAVGVITTYLQ